MQQKSRTYGDVLPVVIDTIQGREMEMSAVVLENNDTLCSLRIPHLMSPEHRDEMIELPY